MSMAHARRFMAVIELATYRSFKQVCLLPSFKFSVPFVQDYTFSPELERVMPSQGGRQCKWTLDSGRCSTASLSGVCSVSVSEDFFLVTRSAS